MTRGSPDAAVTGQQRGVEDLRKSDIRGIISGQVLLQLPDSGQKQLMGMTLQWEIRKSLKRLQGTSRIDFATSDKSA